MITVYDSNKIDSLDTKQVIKFLDEMHFDIQATGKSFRDKILMKTIIIKELY